MSFSRLLKASRTLAFRISATVFVALCLLFMGNYFGNYRALKKSLSSSVRTTIEQTSQLLNTAVSASSNVTGGDLRTLEVFFKEVVNGEVGNGIVYVIVMHESGATLLRAGTLAEVLPLPDSQDQFEACAVRGICHVRDPILLKGNEIGFLQYGLATQSSIAALTQAYANGLAITSIATLLIFSVFAASGLGIARRASRLSRASKEIALGNYAIRVKASGTDELSDLSASFNRMADAIEAKIAEIYSLKEGLETRVKERTEELQTSNQLLAANVTQLGEAREQLVKSEKLVGLGALVAGVSHELNTPIGNALIAATTVHEKTQAFSLLLADEKVTRNALQQFVKTSVEGNELTVRSLHRAAALISSFKQVAVDQSSERRRQFDLAKTVQEVCSTLNYLLKVAPQRLEIDIAEGIRMDSYPGPLGQVISNLIQNALTHAFEDTAGGVMRLSAWSTKSDRVRIEFRDDGCGIPEHNLRRIFDPFFTTRLGQGGNGLGLSIVNNIVEGLLGGAIQVESVVGAGTLFVIDLPLVAPK